jgi:hypothetical protein
MTSVMATPASASPAPRGPQVISPWLQRVDAGEAEWVNVWFRGMDRRVCDFKMFVRDTRQVDVSYPRHRHFATLSNDSTLTRGERDRASFRVEANFRRDANAILSATVSYNDCGRHSRTQFKRFGLLLPIDGDWNGHGNGGHGNGNGGGHGNGNGGGHGNGNGGGHGNGGQGNNGGHGNNGNDGNDGHGNGNNDGHNSHGSGRS